MRVCPLSSVREVMFRESWRSILLRIDISLLMSNEEIASNIEVFFDWRVYLEVPILKNWFSLAEALFEMRVDSIVFSASPSSRVDWPALG